MSSDSIPSKTPRSSLYSHAFHCTEKVLTFMSWTGECRRLKHTQHAPSTETECDYLNGWIKNGHRQKSHPKW